MIKKFNGARKIFQKTLVITFSVSAVLGILFLGNYVVKAIQTGGAGHNNVEKDSQGKSIAGYGYDVTICSSGCDYTDFSEGITAAGTSSTIYIGSGTYTETNTVTLGAGQSIYFDSVDLVLNGAYLSLNDNLYLRGILNISGTGDDSTAYLRLTYHDNVNAENLSINIDFTNINDTVGKAIRDGGVSCSYNINITGTFNRSNALYVWDSDRLNYSTVEYTAYNLINEGSGVVFALNDKSTHTFWNVNLNNIDSVGTARAIYMQPDCDFNTYIGNTYADDANGSSCSNSNILALNATTF